MKAWRLILVPFLISLVLSVPSHSKEKFLWAINPEVHGSNLNAEIITLGYGFAYTRTPFKYREDFRQCEREAREIKRELVTKIYKTYS